MSETGTSSVLQSGLTEIVCNYWPPLPDQDDQRGTILIVAGKSIGTDLHVAFDNIAYQFGRAGFGVVAFIYRDIEHISKETEILSYRIEDTKRAMRYMKECCKPPFSILGLRTGAHIAIQAAAETSNGRFFENVILVAPKIQAFLHPSLDARKSASIVNAGLLLIYYGSEKGVPVESRLYYEQFGGNLQALRRSPVMMGHLGKPPHSSPEGIAALSHCIDEIVNFTTPPR